MTQQSQANDHATEAEYEEAAERDLLNQGDSNPNQNRQNYEMYFTISRG